MCDRVIVIREGEISGEVVGDAMTEENIMQLASMAERKQEVAMTQLDRPR